MSKDKDTKRTKNSIVTGVVSQVEIDPDHVGPPNPHAPRYMDSVVADTGIRLQNPEGLGVGLGMEAPEDIPLVRQTLDRLDDEASRRLKHMEEKQKDPSRLAKLLAQDPSSPGRRR